MPSAASSTVSFVRKVLLESIKDFIICCKSNLGVTSSFLGSCNRANRLTLDIVHNTL
jgi:hypothetical protein